MSKSYYSLGLMSGTSMDGVDASIIQSDGETKYKVILDKYFEYPEGIYKELIKLRDKIISSKDLKKFSKEIKEIEKKITLFQGKLTREIIKESRSNINFIGFHGQTIYHNAKEKISIQLGDGKLLAKTTKKTVIYDFRQNDLKNGGQGAPLTPIFHKLLVTKNKIEPPVGILNIGGIANFTSINTNNNISSLDIGAGNCLIDKWMREKSRKQYDKNGEVAQSGQINKMVLDQALDNFYNNDLSKKRSYDIKDFDLSFIRGLSLEDGAATLTDYTAKILSKKIPNNLIFLCGGGRKNKFLVKSIQEKIKGKIKLIDDLGIDGDFVESQAFAFLAIRTYLKLPISFPETTGVKEPCLGGKIFKN